jgi:hypothetical protein
MNEISKYAFENLRTDGELNLYRGRGTKELPPILVVAPVARQPDAQAVRHAGAERGLLILQQGEEYRIEAEAKVGPSGVEVQLRHAPTRRYLALRRSQCNRDATWEN